MVDGYWATKITKNANSCSTERHILIVETTQSAYFRHNHPEISSLCVQIQQVFDPQGELPVCPSVVRIIVADVQIPVFNSAHVHAGIDNWVRGAQVVFVIRYSQDSLFPSNIRSSARSELKRRTYRFMFRWQITFQHHDSVSNEPRFVPPKFWGDLVSLYLTAQTVLVLWRYSQICNNSSLNVVPSHLLDSASMLTWH